MPRRLALLLVLCGCDALPFHPFKPNICVFPRVQAPVTAIAAPADGDLFTELQALAFEARAADPDDGPEALHAELRLHDGRVLAEGAPDAAGELRVALDPLPPGNATLHLELTDPTGERAVDTVDISIQPVDIELHLGPDPAGTDDDLKAEVLVDWVPSEDPSTLTFAWTEDGAPLAEAGPVLPAAATAKGRTYGLTVGHAAGAVGGTTATAELTIGNTPPGAPALQISPAGAGPGDALVCEVVSGSVDADGDPVAYTMSWTVDGAPATADGAVAWPGDTVEGAATAGGGRWACTATPDDGEAAGEPGLAEVELGAM